MKWLAILSLLVACVARADVQSSFPPGRGARYSFASAAGQAELTVSIAESAASRVVVEFFFTQAGLLPVQMWQQFVLDVHVGSAPAVAEGVLLTREGRAPERIPAELLNGLEDASVSDFLFSSRADLDRFKKGEEKIQVLAARAPLSCTRYEQQRGAQTVTYWISDEAKPIGLVKLRSRGAKPTQNYDLELSSLLTNVGAKIDRKKAVPLTAEGRALLSTKL